MPLEQDGIMPAMPDIATQTDPDSVEEASPPARPVVRPDILNWAMDTGPRMGPFHRAVLVAISRYADDQGYANPAQATIAKDLDCTRPAVNRAVKGLVGLGLLEVETVVGDNGPYNRYRLTGVDRDWRPREKDMQQEASIDGAYRAVISDLRAEIVRKDEGIRTMALRLGDAGVIVDDSVTDDYTPSSLVVVKPNQFTNQGKTTTTTVPVTEDDNGGGGVTDDYTPPQDGRGRDDAAKNRLQGITMDVDRHWESLRKSAAHPGGWEKKRSAIRWYELNYDNAPPGSFSFLEQMQFLADGQPGPEEDSSPETPVATGEASAEAQKVWSEVMAALEAQLPRSAFQTWLKATEGHSIGQDGMVVSAATSFAVDWLERRMYNAIQKTVEQVTGQPLEVHFVVRVGQ